MCRRIPGWVVPEFLGYASSMLRCGINFYGLELIRQFNSQSEAEKVKNLLRFILSVAFLPVPVSLPAVELSTPTRIDSVLVRDDLGVIRLEVLTPLTISNEPGCLIDNLIDIRLDAENRSETEQRELLNLVNLALVSRRQVRFFLLDNNDPDNCSTVGTSSSIRVAVGIQAIY